MSVHPIQIQMEQSETHLIEQPQMIQQQVQMVLPQMHQIPMIQQQMPPQMMQQQMPPQMMQQQMSPQIMQQQIPPQMMQQQMPHQTMQQQMSPQIMQQQIPPQMMQQQMPHQTMQQQMPPQMMQQQMQPQTMQQQMPPPQMISPQMQNFPIMNQQSFTQLNMTQQPIHQPQGEGFHNLPPEYQQFILSQIQQGQQNKSPALIFDVPQNWDSEETQLTIEREYCCFGETKIYCKTENLGNIVFFRGVHNPCKPCGLGQSSQQQQQQKKTEQSYKCGCSFCDFSSLKGHGELFYRFINQPEKNCHIEIEMCCYKTSIIRYKGVALGIVEPLVSGLCSTDSRYLIYKMNDKKSAITLIPDYSCLNKCDRHPNCSPCRYPKTIEVHKFGMKISEIKNTEISNPMCLSPSKPIFPPFAQGLINLIPELDQAEKILLIAGWAIQQFRDSKIMWMF